jgi:hypothetical protein
MLLKRAFLACGKHTADILFSADLPYSVEMEVEEMVTPH